MTHALHNLPWASLSVGYYAKGPEDQLLFPFKLSKNWEPLSPLTHTQLTLTIEERLSYNQEISFIFSFPLMVSVGYKVALIAKRGKVYSTVALIQHTGQRGEKSE